MGNIVYIYCRWLAGSRPEDCCAGKGPWGPCRSGRPKWTNRPLRHTVCAGGSSRRCSSLQRVAVWWCCWPSRLSRWALSAQAAPRRRGARWRCRGRRRAPNALAGRTVGSDASATIRVGCGPAKGAAACSCAMATATCRAATVLAKRLRARALQGRCRPRRRSRLHRRLRRCHRRHPRHPARSATSTGE